MARVSPSTLDKYPPAESFTGPVVQIIVGKPGETQTFNVHKDVICFYSGYFDAALNGKFAEAEKKEVEMPTEKIETFKAFAHWMYTRQLSARKSKSPFTDFFLLWVFGDAHQIPMLQNVVVNRIVKTFGDEWKVPICDLPQIYENTPKGSKLRQLAIDMIGKTGTARTITDQPDYWNNESLLDLVNIVWADDFAREGKEEVLKWNTCQYHVHEEGAECKNTRPA